MVSFSNFHQLDPAVRDVAIELLANADGQAPSFLAFIYRWMAFNGWMSAVTLEDTDAAMINAFASAPRLAAAYHQLMVGELVFRQLVGDFAAMWPVLNVRDVRKKLGYDAFRHYDRAGLLAACAAANVKQQPGSWAPGAVPDWEQLLRSIYQVRCNLFHGEKSPQSGRDRDLVLMSDRILQAFIAESDCFGWHDQ